MVSATQQNHGSLSFNRVCAYAAALGGSLEVIAGLRLFDNHADLTELLYVMTDLCLMLGLLGWHLHQHDKVATPGLVGFLLAFSGTGFIAGPSAQIFGFTAYSLGVPVITLGLLTMALCSLSKGTLPRWIIGLFLGSFVLAITSMLAPVLYQPIAFFNIAYGAGFLSLSYFLLNKNQ